MPWPRPWRALHARPRARTLTLAFALPLLLAVAPLPAQTIDDGLMMSKQAALHRLLLHARQLGPVLGRHAEARQRQHRHDHDADRHLGGQLRRDGSPQRDRHDAVRLDTREPGRAPRHERFSGPHGGGQVQPPRDRLHAPRQLAADRRRVGGLPERLHARLSARSRSGSRSRRFSGRLTLNFQTKQGWFVERLGAYTWRDDVTLDRPTYYTDGRLFLSDQVAMPDVFDYTVSVGYLKDGLYVPISFSQQITLGGGDIRRQDMPFVSNRMNSSRGRRDGRCTTSRSRRTWWCGWAPATRSAAATSGRAPRSTAGLLYTLPVLVERSSR